MFYNYPEKSDGTTVAKESNPAVHDDLLEEMWKWKADSLGKDDVMTD